MHEPLDANDVPVGWQGKHYTRLGTLAAYAEDILDLWVCGDLDDVVEFLAEAERVLPLIPEEHAALRAAMRQEIRKACENAP